MTFNTSLFPCRRQVRQPSQAGDLFTSGQRINNVNAFLHTHYSPVSLTSFRTGAVPDRTTNLPPGWPVRSHWAFPKCRYCPNWAPTDTPESPDYTQHPLAGYSRTALSLSLHIHSQPCVDKYVRAFTIMLFYVYGLSPYCCSTCSGFHRTAVLFLSELYTNRDPMDLLNYPLNTIPNTCISI